MSEQRCCCAGDEGEVFSGESSCDPVVCCRVSQQQQQQQQYRQRKEGVLELMKKGFFGGKTWRRHFFVLDGPRLSYAKSCKEGTPPDGVVELNHCSVWDASKDMGKSHCFVVYHPNREPLYVSAASDEEKQLWMHEIKDAAERAPWRDEDLFTSESSSEDEEKHRRKLQKRKKRMNQEQARKRAAERGTSSSSSGAGAAGQEKAREREQGVESESPEKRGVATRKRTGSCSGGGGSSEGVEVTEENVQQQVEQLSRFVEALTHSQHRSPEQEQLVEALREPIKEIAVMLGAMPADGACVCGSASCDSSNCAEYSGGSPHPLRPQRADF